MDRNERSIEAMVSGTDLYQVSIELNGARSKPRLSVYCTCPYFSDWGDCCKHIWATLLTIDDQHLLAAPAGRLTLDSGFDDGYDDENELGDGDADVEEVGDKLRKKPEQPQWSRFLSNLAVRSYSSADTSPSIKNPIEPVYILEAADNPFSSLLALSLAQQNVLKNGTLGKFKKLSIKPADIERLENALDRHICLMLVGASPPEQRNHYYSSSYYNTDPYRPATSSFHIPSNVWPTILPMLFQTGRFLVRTDSRADPIPLRRDDGESWEFFLSLDELDDSAGFALKPRLRRGSDVRDIRSIQCMLAGDPALLVQDNTAFDVRTHQCPEWIQAFQDAGQLALAPDELDLFVQRLSDLNRLPPIEWPENWKITEITDLKPRPELRLTYDDRATGGRAFAGAAVKFLYDNIPIEFQRPGSTILDAQAKRQILRDVDAERRHMHRLLDAGVEFDPYSDHFRVKIRLIPGLVRTLLAEDWTVLGNDKKFTNHSSVSISVSSGIDWFELEGQIDFDGQSVSIPDLLKAVRSGEAFVKLGDASMGMLPEQWLAKFGNLLEMGQIADDHVRFTKTQIGLIDVLLAEMPEASFDKALADARRKLRKFSGIKPRKAPAGFRGTLREYQEEGLGWLHFLRELSWGGCLADDMGLGKTVQALALLRNRRRNAEHRCSLIVVPKSIVFNWMREAQRFAPALDVIDYTGTERKALRDKFDSTDLVITTYGTMKRDIEFLADREFDYVILDEAQAIKNPNSQNAKAARVLQARHRLVMTGTPVENRLEDLWSLFEFLNPGMLGSSRTFARSFARPRADQPEDTNLTTLRRVLRPFILRRKKEQVAPDLPDRSEQIVDCTMARAQAKYYKELRDYYRGSLLKKVDKVGLAKSKIHVLEALLRLRQAACHPGLVDKKRTSDESAKLEAMIPMIQELVSEGHKALIFSQFTTMLGIIRNRLDKLGLVYEYLDGKTRKREDRVDRFQNDPDCPLFLISLKAGGTGLNLTAADYVFITDPWWNPAVETQAIDRTHRIGQDKSVMAYRLITRDTVESKIMELQQSKRELANAVITQDNSVIRNLTREDLDVLLS